MSTFIVVIHVVVSIALILIVLLQTGRGSEIGAAFGGGSSQTLFGSTGVSPFLSKLTTVAAIIFMLTSLGLAYMSSRKATISIMSEVAVPRAQETQQPPAQTGTKGETTQAPLPNSDVPHEKNK